MASLTLSLNQKYHIKKCQLEEKDLLDLKKMCIEYFNHLYYLGDDANKCIQIFDTAVKAALVDCIDSKENRLYYGIPDEVASVAIFKDWLFYLDERISDTDFKLLVSYITHDDCLYVLSFMSKNKPPTIT